MWNTDVKDNLKTHILGAIPFIGETSQTAKNNQPLSASSGMSEGLEIQLLTFLTVHRVSADFTTRGLDY